MVIFDGKLDVCCGPLMISFRENCVCPEDIRDSSVKSSSTAPKKVTVENGQEIRYNIEFTILRSETLPTGADDYSVPFAPLTYLELFSRAKSRNKTIWLIPPVYHWYQGSRPGGCLSIDCRRRNQTTLTSFLSGHIRSLTFSDNSNCFEIFPKYAAEQATSDHILACLGLSKQDLVSNPLLTLDFIRVYRLMDLI
ncbi:hypothetical protein AVEN_48969-1 [Araneus ventricosus]|uniref:Uncharacterized protein n=1 Tax=Araneus ventricosus TaxID=182803 RepID=A0A4Y2AGM7_ARAVE|nr:hypothetical protein AVEN_48969-1 [Araneus ventricosus]